jgi:transcriptional regulator with XRE-family HTH domain
MSALRRKRESFGLLLQDVATEIGVSVNAVSEWERGKSMPKPKHRLLLEKLFNRPIYELFPGSGFKSGLPYNQIKRLNKTTNTYEWRKKYAPEIAQEKVKRLEEFEEKLWDPRFLIPVVMQLAINYDGVFDFMRETVAVHSDIENSNNFNDAKKSIQATCSEHSSKYRALQAESDKIGKNFRARTFFE